MVGSSSDRYFLISSSYSCVCRGWKKLLHRFHRNADWSGHICMGIHSIQAERSWSISRDKACIKLSWISKVKVKINLFVCWVHLNTVIKSSKWLKCKTMEPGMWLWAVVFFFLLFDNMICWPDDGTSRIQMKVKLLSLTLHTATSTLRHLHCWSPSTQMDICLLLQSRPLNSSVGKKKGSGHSLVFCSVGLLKCHLVQWLRMDEISGCVLTLTHFNKDASSRDQGRPETVNLDVVML